MCKKLPGFKPGLAIVQVGGREDSNVYIRMKKKAAEEIGIEVSHIQFPKTITQDELVKEVSNESALKRFDWKIDRSDNQNFIHPAWSFESEPENPRHHRSTSTRLCESNRHPRDHWFCIPRQGRRWIAHTQRRKSLCWRYDRVLAVHSQRLHRTGKISVNHFMISYIQNVWIFIWTRMIIFWQIKKSGVSMIGANAVVLGRSKIVGTPMAELLKWNHATVTVCHSKTANLSEVVSNKAFLN